MKKDINDAENLLIEIVRILGPKIEPCKRCQSVDDCRYCYFGVIDEVNCALDLIHKYFGLKEIKEIYKELNYSFKK